MLNFEPKYVEPKYWVLHLNTRLSLEPKRRRRNTANPMNIALCP